MTFLRSQRQRKFFHNLQQPEHTQAAEAYTRHACRQLVWMQETTQPPPVQSVSRLRKRCG
jgi:hypothetical protein